MAKKEKIVTDPFGSYTGLVRHPEEKPVQDADDLRSCAEQRLHIDDQL